MIVKIFREGLGRLIILGDTLTRPKSVQRSAEAQDMVNEQTKAMSLYQFYACPFCTKTRRAIRRLNLPIEIRDAQKPGPHRNELNDLGGKVKVPCLRIEQDGQVRWLYDSNNIIDYLEQQFGTA